MDKFKTGDYLVYLGDRGQSYNGQDIKINHIYKFLHYPSMGSNWVICEWLNGNSYSAPSKKHCRRATPEEIELFKKYNKPVNINLLKQELIYEIF